jgi:Zn finger protein HypA/HybF involved in hydrogenase expression
MICEKCKEKYKTEYVQIPVCPKCDGKLVEYKEPINKK